MFRTFLIYVVTYFCSFLAIFIQVFLPVVSVPHYGEMVEMSYRSVASCALNISENELFWKPSVVLVTGNNKTDNVTLFDEMSRKLNSQNMPSIIVDVVEYDTLDAAKANYLVIEYFRHCEDLMKFDFNNLRKRIKYLFLVEAYHDCSPYLTNIGKVAGKYDVSFFVQYSNKNWDLYTYIPEVVPNICDVVINNPIKINTCFEGRLGNSMAFPSKVTTNFMRCPIKVGLGSLYPFSIIDNKETLQTYDLINISSARGMDVEIAKIMIEYFNASPNFRYIYKVEENPFVDTSYLQLLINGSLEFCVGGIYRIFGDVVEYSGIYASQSVMWIYYAERVKKTWEDMAVSIDGLYLFIIFYLGYSLVWCLLRSFDKNSFSLNKILLYSWGALLGTTALQEARTLKQKILNIVYLNMCLHLSVYISIQLYSFFTIQGPPKMFRTNEDIMKSGREVFLKPITKYFTTDEKYLTFANTSKDCDSFLDCAELSYKYNGVTVYTTGLFHLFQAQTSVHDEARMLRSDESLLTVFYEMIIRKDSPLVLKFQRATVRLFEVGIMDKLFKEAIGLTVVGKAKIAAENMVSSSYACQLGCKLDFNQFYGVFYIWAVGCFTSICVFIMEIVIHKPGNSMGVTYN